jgi:peptide/nickel transport system substrate-binding protein
MRSWLRRVAVPSLAVVLAGSSGCGGGGATRFPGSEHARAGGGGELVYALAADPGSLYPLAARTASQQLVSRQLFEPLVETLQGPYERVRNRRGLALEWTPSQDRRVWSFRLRPDVRFQDGTPFNASAVVANATRWRGDPAAEAILPELLAADAPRPNLARIILSRPVEDLPHRLSDPRLGLISPRALAGLGPSPAPGEVGRAGSGPFELAREEASGTMLLERNRRWWGTRLGLGPALDRVEFRPLIDRDTRVALLRRGAVLVAADVGRGEAAALARDPLLATIGEGGDFVAMERSVRGITGPGPQSLSGAWLTVVGQGG